MQDVHIYADLFPESRYRIADVGEEVSDWPGENGDCESLAVAVALVACLVKQLLSHVRVVAHAPAGLVPVRVVDVVVGNLHWPADAA